MLATANPFPFYADLDGQPLDAGSIYFGTPNQNPETSPVTVYWDAAGTQPAAQPIRTINGYTVRNGTPAVVYASSDYSLTVRNSNGVILYFAATSAAFSNDFSLQNQITALTSNLASHSTAGVGAGMVGFDPTLSYVAATLGRSLADREWNPRDFPWLAKFDGVTDDTAAIQACWQALFDAGGGTMVLPRGTAKVTSVVMNYTSGVTVNVRGQGQHATYFAKLGAGTTPVLDIKSNTGVLDVYSKFSGFQVLGANSCDGIKLTTIANLRFEFVEARGCGVGLNLAGSLVSSYQQCSFLSNSVGVQMRKDSGIYCNSNRFYDCCIKANTSLGMDINHASDLLFSGCDIESNGTTLNLTTGAVIIQADVDEEVGISTITFNGGTHFEGNKGSNFVAVSTPGFRLVMDDVSILSSEAGLALSIQAIASVSLKGVVAASPGDVVTIGATATSSIEDCNIATITDSSTHQYRKNNTGGLGITPCSTKSIAIGTGGMTLDQTAKFQCLGAFSQGAAMVTFQDGAAAGNQVNFYQTNGAGGNAAGASVKIGTHSVTGRSINVGGSVNVGGADYAEYETKRHDCGVIAKGDIVGFDADGLLTDRFGLSVMFGVKSTAPSYVGGDDWFTEQPPEMPVNPTDEQRSQHAQAMAEFEHRLDTARQRVDRIAYAGKVPVNVTGASLGDYIVPMAGGDGGIIGIAIANPDHTQYRSAIGRVRCILPDGRPQIVVKVL